MSKQLSLALVILMITLARDVCAQSAAQQVNSTAAQHNESDLALILANTNRNRAGKLHNGVLTIALVAKEGRWYPEDDKDPGITVQALGEEGHPLQIPGPMIRVAAGTEIRATIKNIISNSTLVMHGFHSRPGDSADSFEVPPGQTRAMRFKAGEVGTYYYYATTTGLLVDGKPVYSDSQLYGAFIVDPPGKPVSADERIFIIGFWGEPVDNFKPDDADFKRSTFLFNGKSWPYTERLMYTAGQSVNWRLINASYEGHPLHLHGFYYQVNSKGDIEHDHIYNEQERRRAVTEFLPDGGTMSMTWAAERAGRWLFHCHMIAHISPEVRLTSRPAPDHNAHEQQNHAIEGMAGLILGIDVKGTGDFPKPAKEATARREITLIAQEQPGRFDKFPGQGFVLKERDTEPAANQISIPGPTVVLTRGEPVGIKIINKLHDETSVHWHGIELESYFDGVADWGRTGTSITPIIKPGGSFTAEMTPPRAGTFLYHTHMHNQQLGSGMFGPLIVMEPGEKFDPSTDKIMLISVGGPDDDSASLLNGSDKPETMQLSVGVKYRFRLINITYNNARLVVSLVAGDSPVDWRAVAKDGANLSSSQAVTEPARQQLTVGETRDFEFRPAQAGDLRFEVRNSAGVVRITMPVQVR